jgi:hypothetical protein
VAVAIGVVDVVFAVARVAVAHAFGSVLVGVVAVVVVAALAVAAAADFVVRVCVLYSVERRHASPPGAVRAVRPSRVVAGDVCSRVHARALSPVCLWAVWIVADCSCAAVRDAPHASPGSRPTHGSGVCADALSLAVQVRPAYRCALLLTLLLLTLLWGAHCCEGGAGGHQIDCARRRRGRRRRRRRT